jgi:hypothetical protein
MKGVNMGFKCESWWRPRVAEFRCPGGYWGLGRLLEERFGFGFLIVNLCFLKALDEDDGSTGVIHLIFSEEFLKASGRIGT